MRYVKFAITGLLALYILLTIIGLLMPSSVTVLRSVDINAPLDSVRFYTNDPAHWRAWINGADTSYYKQLTSSTTERNSKLMLGTYTVTVLNTYSNYIVSSWQGQTTHEQLNRLELYYSNTGTTVNWSFQQQLNWYPWERLGGMLYDKVYGPSMEASLANLKKVCEK